LICTLPGDCGHTGSDGSSPQARIADAGYTQTGYTGEIVYWGTGSAATPTAALAHDTSLRGLPTVQGRGVLGRYICDGAPAVWAQVPGALGWVLVVAE
jgi:hypothetical protein